jgi:hypothetical protein
MSMDLTKSQELARSNGVRPPRAPKNTLRGITGFTAAELAVPDEDVSVEEAIVRAHRALATIRKILRGGRR